MRRIITWSIGLVLIMSSMVYAQMTVRDSDTHVLMQVNDEGSVGSISLPSGSAPSSPSGKLYNQSGALYCNGSALATSGSGGGWNDDGTAVRLSHVMDMVGIGTAIPEFKLTIDSDGGILAKGTHHSGPSLITSGEGARLIWYPRKAAFRAGYVEGGQWNDINIGEFSTATGMDTQAKGTCSTAMGYASTATGNYSVALGSYLSAESISSVALGKHNVGGGTATSWVDTDPIFEVGIGTGSSAKKNALTVLKNGNIGIGTVNPAAPLVVNGNVWTDRIIDNNDSDFYLNPADTSVLKMVRGNTFQFSTPKICHYSVGDGHFNSLFTSSIPINHAVLNEDDTYTGFTGGTYMQFAGSGVLVAPVLLPDSAIVTDFQASIFDFCISGDLSISLVRKEFGLSDPQDMANLVHYNSMPFYVTFSTTSISNATIDNTSASYHIRIENINGGWPGTSELMILGALVTYTVNEAQ